MIAALLSLYSPRYPSVLVYMLQSTEYRVGPYLKWYWRTRNFNAVMYRRNLQPTRAARLLLVVLWAGTFAQLVAGITLMALWHWQHLAAGWQFGAALIIGYPIVWAHLVAVPLVFGRIVVVWPREKWLVAKSRKVFATHPGVKIAIAGSYGKTSMKELLLTVLSEGKRVAATPANKNVAISHAQFARTLMGDEDILLLEYGEGAPGDVARFARNTHPTHAVITGLSPAHLDRYKTVERAGKDIFSVAEYLHGKQVYVNADSPLTKDFLQASYETYSTKGALGWRTKHIAVEVTGTSFDLTKGKATLHLQSGLLGRHQAGPLALAAALGLELGLSEEQVVQGLAKALPFEHRMQPYELRGAWIIDDTYNGNIDGVRAGLAVLKELSARRKWYVTPGLVDQGRETKQIHEEIGKLIATTNPDVVVLMQNSVTRYIHAGLQTGGFAGELRIEPDPLRFYTNLQQFIPAGDLALLQNDWPDNYW